MRVLFHHGARFDYDVILTSLEVEDENVDVLRVVSQVKSPPPGIWFQSRVWQIHNNFNKIYVVYKINVIYKDEHMYPNHPSSVLRDWLKFECINVFDCIRNHVLFHCTRLFHGMLYECAVHVSLTHSLSFANKHSATFSPFNPLGVGSVFYRDDSCSHLDKKRYRQPNS